MIVFKYEKRHRYPPWTHLSITYLGDTYTVVNCRNGCRYMLNGNIIRPADLPKCKSIRQLKECYSLVCQDIVHSIQRPDSSTFAIIQEKVEEFNRRDKSFPT